MAPLRFLWRGGRRHATLLAIMFVVTLPMLAAIASLIGQHWHSSGDQALEILRIDDVGTIHTPLVGTYSRWGWAHPGPLLFWQLAPFNLTFGSTGVLVGVGIANLLTSVAIVGVAFRRGGTALALLTGLMLALLQRAVGVDFLIDPWNPWVALLPFVLLILLVWSALCDDLVTLPIAVVVGSYIVQTHVGYLVMVGGLIAIVCVRNLAIAVGERRPLATPLTDSPSTSRRPSARTRLLWGLVTMLVALLAWSPAIVQQLTGDPGNLGELLTYASDPGKPTLGWSDAFGEMGSQIRPVADWMTGHTPLLATTASTWPAIGLLLAIAAFGIWTWRRGHRDRARLCVTTLVVVGLGVVSAAHITGDALFFVVRWWWVLGALVMLTLTWVIVSSLPDAMRRAALGATAAITVGVTVASLAGLPAQVPDARMSRAFGHLGQMTADALHRDHRYIVRAAAPGSSNALFVGGLERGLFVELEERGFSVFVDATPLGDLTYGPWRLARTTQVHEIITIVPTAGLSSGYVPPTGAQMVASWDPLTSAERKRAREIEASIRAAVPERAPKGALLLGQPATRSALKAAGALRAEIDELYALQQRGESYIVFVSPASTPRAG